MSKHEHKLSAKQQRFVEQYLIDLNAGAAAIRAGYSPKFARQSGHQLLTNIYIAAAVAAGRERLAKEAGITAQRVEKNLASMTFVDIRDFYSEDGSVKRPNELTVEQAAAVQSFSQGADGSYTYKLVDRLAATITAGKHVGMFRSKVDVNHEGTVEVAEGTGGTGGRGVEFGALGAEDQENLVELLLKAKAARKGKQE